MFDQLKYLWVNLEYRRKSQLAFLLILMLLSSFVEMLSISMFMPFISLLISPESFLANHNLHFLIPNQILINIEESILYITFTLITCLIMSGILRVITLWFQTKLSFYIGADLSLKLLENTLYQPYKIHLDTNTSEIIAAIRNKTSGVATHIVMNLLNIICSILLITGLILPIIWLNSNLVFILFGIFATIYYFIVFFTKKKLKSYSVTISENSNQVIKILQESLNSVRDIILNNSQSEHVKNYAKADMPLRKAEAYNHVIATSPRFIIEAIAMTLLAAIAYFLYLRNTSLITFIPIFAVIVLVIQRIFPQLQQIYFSISSILGSKSILVDINSLMSKEWIGKDEHKEKNHNKLFFNKEIRLENIKFKYSKNGPIILNNLNLKIKKGTIVGIIGKSGCGKSTLIDIIMGLLTPTNGNIIVDGKRITKNNILEWQKKISHVPQSIYLTDENVGKNISFGMPTDMDKIIRSSKSAQIHNTIIKWKNKCETIIGESGSKLSGGQKQRIAIARALYRDKEILILDEATSAADFQTEKAILESVCKVKNDKTIIFITHRRSSLKYCDSLIEVHNGKIKQIS